jgi:hypothetical protein
MNAVSTKKATLYVPIPNLDGFEAGEDGRIRTTKSKWAKNKDAVICVPEFLNVIVKKGHAYVSIINREKSVADLMLTTFVEPRPKGMVAVHLNGDTLDNRPENLKWGTVKEAMKYAIKHGKIKKGEAVYGAKLTETTVYEARVMEKLGFTPRQITDYFDIVSLSTMKSALSGETWPDVPFPV